jgi:hypothetical protein
MPVGHQPGWEIGRQPGPFRGSRRVTEWVRAPLSSHVGGACGDPQSPHHAPDSCPGGRRHGCGRASGRMFTFWCRPAPDLERRLPCLADEQLQQCHGAELWVWDWTGLPCRTGRLVLGRTGGRPHGGPQVHRPSAGASGPAWRCRRINDHAVRSSIDGYGEHRRERKSTLRSPGVGCQHARGRAAAASRPWDSLLESLVRLAEHQWHRVLRTTGIRRISVRGHRDCCPGRSTAPRVSHRLVEAPRWFGVGVRPEWSQMGTAATMDPTDCTAARVPLTLCAACLHLQLNWQCARLRSPCRPWPPLQLHCWPCSCSEGRCHVVSSAPQMSAQQADRNAMSPSPSRLISWPAHRS